MFSKEFELKQMHIDAYVMPDCQGKLRKIAARESNWDLYYNDKARYCMSIAKPISGASDSIYGNLSHIYKQIRTGIIKKSELTKYGARILRKNGYDIRAI